MSMEKGFLGTSTVIGLGMEQEMPSWRPALEKAAKYICNQNCGRCPLVVENHPCPVECTTEVVPWQCWLAYFTTQAE